MKRLGLAVLAFSLISATGASAQTSNHRPGAHRPAHHATTVKRHVVKQGPVVTTRKVVTKRRWAKGGYLPARHRRHVIHSRDYHRYRLHPPPHGYHWVRVDNEFILVSMATGLITSIIMGR